MTIEDIKNFLDDTLIKQLKLNTIRPTRLKQNIKILENILFKYNWLKNTCELLFLLKHKNELEKLHIFCPVCGKKNKFNRTSKGYFTHCSKICRNRDEILINKTRYKRRNDIDKNGFDSYKRANLKMQKYYQTKEGVSNYLQTKEGKNKLKNLQNQIKKASGDTCEIKYGNRIYARSAHRFYLDPNHKHYEDINEKFFRDNFIINGKFDSEKCINHFGTKIGWVAKFKKKFNIFEENIKNCISKPQKQVHDFIKQIYYNKIDYGTFKIISPQELDIYLPDVNLAIEFNGVYWHSTKANKHKYYHQNKFKACLSKGIRLIHIYEDEWSDNRKQEIIKNIVKRTVGLDTKIANNYVINEVSEEQYIDFCNKYNLDGYKEADIKLGLFNNSKLIQVLAFKNKYNYYKIIVNCCNFDLYKDYTKQLLEYFNVNYNKRKLHIMIDIFCDKDEIQVYLDYGFKIVSLLDPRKRKYKDLVVFDSGVFTLII